MSLEAEFLRIQLHGLREVGKMCNRSIRHSVHGRRAFSIVELLIVLAIIGASLAMILPAIMAARESARTVQCGNKLKQFALGLQNYHDLHGSLPPGWICDRPDQRMPQWGWGALLLPLIEQQFLNEALDPGPNSIADAFAWDPTGGQLQSSISSFRCPSSRSDDLNTRKEFDRGVGVPQGWQAPSADYICSVGFFSRTGNYENHGVMYGNSGIPLRAVKDGTSSTILLGERDTLGLGGTWIGIPNPQLNGADGFAWVGGVVSVPMNSRVVPGNRDQGFSSRHPGGAQFAFCDGSVRFVSEKIDFNNGSADSNDLSNCLLTNEQKAELGVYQCLGVRDDKRSVSERR
jgi:prepilin-type processing-associated H-X9-DG protein/prepilin-type N-terminal cleavage/methylation domain-containing protein